MCCRRLVVGFRSHTSRRQQQQQEVFGHSHRTRPVTCSAALCSSLSEGDWPFVCHVFQSIASPRSTRTRVSAVVCVQAKGQDKECEPKPTSSSSACLPVFSAKRLFLDLSQCELHERNVSLRQATIDCCGVETDERESKHTESVFLLVSHSANYHAYRITVSVVYGHGSLRFSPAQPQDTHSAVSRRFFVVACFGT